VSESNNTYNHRLAEAEAIYDNYKKGILPQHEAVIAIKHLRLQSNYYLTSYGKLMEKKVRNPLP